MAEKLGKKTAIKTTGKLDKKETSKLSRRPSEKLNKKEVRKTTNAADKLNRTEIKKIFDTFDYNGNGILSLAEIDKAVIEIYPHLAEDKPAIMRAYKAADTSQDGFIDFKEFGRLIDLLHYYNDLFQIFKKLDIDNDRRVDFDEFKKGYELMGINGGPDEELKAKFDEIDTNQGGHILFDEFCIYAAKIKLISEIPQDAQETQEIQKAQTKPSEKSDKKEIKKPLRRLSENVKSDKKETKPLRRLLSENGKSDKKEISKPLRRLPSENGKSDKKEISKPLRRLSGNVKLDKKETSKPLRRLSGNEKSNKKISSKTINSVTNTDRTEIKKIFDTFDYNGNGILSLAEIDKAVIEIYPHLAEDKPAIMRAYKAADTSQDGFIDFKEFERLIDLLHYYNNLFQIFKKLDIDNDRRIDFNEFKKGYELMGINGGSDEELKAKFDEIDTNQGGYILFDEFCIYAAKIKLISEIPQDTQEAQEIQKAQTKPSEKSDKKETSKPLRRLSENGKSDKKETSKPLRRLPSENGKSDKKEISKPLRRLSGNVKLEKKETSKPPRRLSENVKSDKKISNKITKLDRTEIKKTFDTFDYNGNGVLSLAEIDKAVIEIYPHLAEDKPAIMRAYKAADTSQDGFIDFKEFGRLIDLLHYYNNLFQIFKKLDIDNDRRIDFDEFKKGYELMKMNGGSDEELKAKFDEIDTNQGGYILFDEFCIYAAKVKLISEIPQDVQETQEIQKAQTKSSEKSDKKETSKTSGKLNKKEISKPLRRLSGNEKLDKKETCKLSGKLDKKEASKLLRNPSVKKETSKPSGKLDNKETSKSSRRLSEKLDKKEVGKIRNTVITTTHKLDRTEIKKIFDIFDYNGNGVLSLAEIDKAVIEIYPHLAEDKPAIMRAYKAADTSQDGFIDFKEFGRLIDLLHYYNNLFQIFKKLDIDNDRRVDFDEFKKGYELMGINGGSDEELKAKFDEIDTNQGGYILFDEFCTYAAKIKLISEIPQDAQEAQEIQKDQIESAEKLDEKEISETSIKLDNNDTSKPSETLDEKTAGKTTSAVTTTNKLDRTEIKKIFNIFDYNGNGILSLAEIDKAVIEIYPYLAEDKPAIMRAYKAADTSQDGFIDFKEFGRLIDLLHYYNNLFQLFKKLDIDNDRRIDFDEFKKGYEIMGINVDSDKELKAKFDEIDINQGGHILFDEFCIYAAKIKMISEIPQDVQEVQET
ncbi:EF-hand [Rhizophagus irregularis]|uniref:EF-hand n=1 Tax=Rhizophagus irregularis TaxID=588596 RepID=A0A2I1H3Y3_9GLOM|nr:EF-hand [Rhizophagus irregularis]